MKELSGFDILGLHHNYIDKTLTLVLEKNINIVFSDCCIILDGGVIGKKIIDFSNYQGEMAFVLELKKYNLEPDDYDYYLINCENNIEFYIGKLRIACKKVTLINDTNS